MIKADTSTLTHKTGNSYIRHAKVLCGVFGDLKNAGHKRIVLEFPQHSASVVGAGCSVQIQRERYHLHRRKETSVSCSFSFDQENASASQQKSS